MDVGEFFVADFDRNRDLAEMSSRRANTFARITQSAALTYNVDGDVIVYDDGKYIVESYKFQDLTIKVFTNPIDLLYSWSYYASGIHEMLTGEGYTWLWGGGVMGLEGQLILLPIKPSHYAYGIEVVPVEKIIGPHWSTLGQ